MPQPSERSCGPSRCATVRLHAGATRTIELYATDASVSRRVAPSIDRTTHMTAESAVHDRAILRIRPRARTDRQRDGQNDQERHTSHGASHRALIIRPG